MQWCGGSVEAAGAVGRVWRNGGAEASAQRAGRAGRERTARGAVTKMSYTSQAGVPVVGVVHVNKVVLVQNSPTRHQRRLRVLSAVVRPVLLRRNTVRFVRQCRPAAGGIRRAAAW